MVGAEYGIPPIPYEPRKPEKRWNQRDRLLIVVIIFTCTLFIIGIIFSPKVFRKFYKKEQSTTKIIQTITVSPSPTQPSIISNNSQCPASNCLRGGTCCFNDQMPNNMHCCNGNTPVCCPPDKGWCCRTHAPVCCGNIGCCRLNTICCTINGIEQCCPDSDNTSKIISVK